MAKRKNLSGLSPEQILAERAEKLAKKKDPPFQGKLVETLEFVLTEEFYAVETKFVREVVRLPGVTFLPSTPDHFVGLANIRGEAVAVYDIRKFFKIEKTGISDMDRVILLASGGITVGILVDNVTGISSIPEEALYPPAEGNEGINPFVKGVAFGIIAVLDGDKIINHPSLVLDVQ